LDTEINTCKRVHVCKLGEYCGRSKLICLPQKLFCYLALFAKSKIAASSSV
jgi:hypothetical protein